MRARVRVSMPARGGSQIVTIPIKLVNVRGDIFYVGRSKAHPLVLFGAALSLRLI